MIISVPYYPHFLIFFLILDSNITNFAQSPESYIFSPLFTASIEFALLLRCSVVPGICLEEKPKILQTMRTLFSFVTSRVRPPVQSHTVRDGSEDPDRSLPLLSGVPDYDWLRFPVHHWGVSNGHRPAYLSAGHHNGHGDIYHRDLPRKGTRAICFIIVYMTYM